jgi:gliding motility-associated-like protein
MLGRLLTVFCAMLQLSVYGQFTNTGEKVFIDRGTVMVVQGDIRNSGTLLHHGELKFTGDWINHDAGRGFAAASSGTVVMTGADQRIGGSHPAAFPRLEVRGSGTKFLDVDTDISASLLLFGELNVNDKVLHIVNPRADAILRTSGFINTDAGGKFRRNTNATEAYSFPIGNQDRYRPAQIIPSGTDEMTFSITMFNEDPTGKGFNRSAKREDVTSVFSRYFYLVNQDRGSAPSSIRFFLNTAPSQDSEGDIRQLLTWGRFPIWEKAGPSTILGGDISAGLDRSLLFTSTSPVLNTAFTLGESNDEPLTFFNAFSPDGDGRNDTWNIGNIDLFPENDLTIYNRWGDAVFQGKGYSSLKSWDGGNNNPGTYYYVLNVRVNGAMKSYKGFITMLKKD